MKRSLWIILILVLACSVSGYFLWPFAFTVVPIEQVEQVKQSEAFDPVVYVDGLWSSQIIPTITESAVDLATILGEFKPNAQGIAAKNDLIEVAKKYGLITVGEAHVYMVKARGTVAAVDTSKSVGIMEIQLEDYPGPIKVMVYIGPRIPSDETSVRDAVGFINFGDFKEQTEYGKVANEINKRVLNEVLSGLEKEQLVGKKVTLYGAMTIRTFNLVDINLKQVNIVPIKIEVE
jgi:predicted lipoprotein